MRATWITSLCSGLVMGVVFAFFRGSKQPLAIVALLGLLAAGLIGGVIGIGQILEARAERRAFGPAASVRQVRHGRFPIPGLGRVLVFGFSAVLAESLAAYFLR